MAGLCEGGNEPPGSLKAKVKKDIGKYSGIFWSRDIRLEVKKDIVESILGYFGIFWSRNIRLEVKKALVESILGYFGVEISD
ncbi:hypothetical protein ANN_20314 [Periplaneta americana]|uniref:Per a allergen n=1 Tax=Periplaneta americana TaxID=6978 RepID=A0ABQ8SC98_PERAM|nr:hypothetical protein ANN_20314 [Periplaneta americana]